MHGAERITDNGLLITFFILSLAVFCLSQRFDLGNLAVRNSRSSGSKGVSVVTSW